MTEHTQPHWNSQAEKKLSNSILLDLEVSPYPSGVRVTDVRKDKTHRPSSKGNWASFDCEFALSCLAIYIYLKVVNLG